MKPNDYKEVFIALELSAKKAEDAIKVFKKGLDKAEEQAKQMLGKEQWRMSTEAQIKASVKYNKDNVKQIKLNLNKKTDSDIIRHLEATDNVQGYIKRLIRNDMK